MHPYQQYDLLILSWCAHLFIHSLNYISIFVYLFARVLNVYTHTCTRGITWKMKMHIAYINAAGQHHFHSFVPNQPLLEHHCIYTLLQGFQESDELLIVPMVSYVITLSPPNFQTKVAKVLPDATAAVISPRC